MHPQQRDLAALARLYQLDSNQEWQALLTCVDFAEAFTFVVLLVPDAAGAELCRTQLIEKLAESGRMLQDRSPRKPEDWGGVLEGLVRQRVDGAAAVVWVEAAVTERDPNFEAWRASWRLAGSRINPFRNMLESSLGCVLIFVGCEWMKPVLRESAPDLWSVRSSVIEIRPPAMDERRSGVLEGIPRDLPVSGNAPDPELALRQVESLRGRPGQELALARALARAGEGIAAKFEWRNAIPLLRESLDLRRQFFGSPAEILYSLQVLGINLNRLGQLPEAYELLKESEQLCHEISDNFGLQVSLGNQALILKAWGRLDDSMALLKEQERISRELGDETGLQTSLGNQAAILWTWGRLDEAMALLKEQERVCREFNDKSGLQASLANQALILKAWGRLDDAIALHKEEEQICRELGDKSGLSASFGNQAVILQIRGRLDEAMALHKEEERISRELGDQLGLQLSLGNQAVILKAWGRLDDAMALHKEGERICRELGDKSGLRRSLGNQALILQSWGRLDDAMALHKEGERICRELGDKSGLQRSMGNQGGILKAWGRLDDATALLKEQEQICRELGDKASLASSLANQSLIHAQRQPPDLDSARKLLTEALQIFTELGMPRERDQAQKQLDDLN